MDDYEVLERLKKASALDGESASDSEWSDLLAAALDAITLLEELLESAESARQDALERDFLD